MFGKTFFLQRTRYFRIHITQSDPDFPTDRSLKKIINKLLFFEIIHLLQDFNGNVTLITTMSMLTFILIVVLVASQFPIVLESEAWALLSSLLITATVTTATLLLAGRHAPLPLFALLIAIHTMLPLSRAVATALATIVTVAHLSTSIAYRIQAEEEANYIQVINFLIYFNLVQELLEFSWDVGVYLTGNLTQRILVISF